MCRLITDLLNITSSKYPDKTAFIGQDRSITFAELSGEAYNIANCLIAKGHFRKPVLIYMEKSVSLVSSFLGVAYSGNFYTPADTKMPEERIRKILDTVAVPTEDWGK